MQPAIYITPAGRDYIATLLAGDRLEITRVMWGDGILPEFQDPYELTDLICPVAQATSTHPVARGAVVSFSVECRNDFNGGLTQRHDLTEFAVYALDAVGAEFMLYMGRLDDEPEPMPALNSLYVVVRRFPVAIAFVVEGVDVVMAFDLAAFVTTQDMEEYTTVTILPIIDALIVKRVKEHNEAPDAHSGLQNEITDHEARIQALETSLQSANNSQLYQIKFDNLDDLVFTGVWNAALQRVEF